VPRCLLCRRSFRQPGELEAEDGSEALVAGAHFVGGNAEAGGRLGDPLRLDRVGRAAPWDATVQVTAQEAAISLVWKGVGEATDEWLYRE
jgi:hypothetical protein